jgi:hypothetical protein
MSEGNKNGGAATQGTRGFLRRSCKQVAALLVAREDRPLRWADRIALVFHMKACDACPRFERQMLTVRNAMHQWRKYEES